MATGGEGDTQKHDAVKALRSALANAPGAEIVTAGRDWGPESGD
nr:hypothetical protein [Halorientalis marina]